MDIMRKIINRPPEPLLPTLIKDRPLVFFDLEFSGLNFDNEIMSIGCVVVKPDDFTIVKEWSVKVKPKNLEIADRKALEMIGYSEEAWKDAVNLEGALKEFNSVVKDAVLVGYNCSWDFLFLLKSYWEENIEISFHWQILDVLSMAYLKLFNEKEIREFRMSEVRRFLGIEAEKSHDALEDAKITYKIFMKLMRYGG